VVRGWYHDLSNGLLQDLTMTVASLADIARAIDLAIAAVQAR
jgi:hypothetical protein